MVAAVLAGAVVIPVATAVDVDAVRRLVGDVPLQLPRRLARVAVQPQVQPEQGAADVGAVVAVLGEDAALGADATATDACAPPPLSRRSKRSVRFVVRERAAVAAAGGSRRVPRTSG